MDINDLGHYSNPSLLILASLAGGERHGYAMMEDIRTMTAIRLGAGTLYGAITRLEQAGLIEPLPLEERRRPYRLTATGAATTAPDPVGIGKIRRPRFKKAGSA